MSLHGTDTIAAIATAQGRGGIGVVRISGPDAFAISEAIAGVSPPPREARLVTLRDRDGDALDQALLLHFPKPRSFTGENVAEFHCHGGPVILARVLRECTSRGARHADPGEFSQRAFLNGKIDLIQAEAIADLIASHSEAAARSASRSLSGEFSTRVNALRDDLIRLRTYIEAAIDFPEEEIDFIAESDVHERLDDLIAKLRDLLVKARRGRRLRDGIKLVIAGAPNAGKSSLLNQLAEQESAIVTSIPGTTRDLLREHIEIDGVPLHIVDTAGLRDARDAVEKEGIRRATAEFATADRILLVIDATEGNDTGDADPIAARIRDITAQLPPEIPVTLVRNKIDLIGEEPGIEVFSGVNGGRIDTCVRLCAQNGAGVELLRRHLLDSAGFGGDVSSDFSARERHVTALEATLRCLETGRDALALHQAGELIAEDLRVAQDRLGSITGRYTSDDLLGEIFGSFCIGK